MFTQWVFNFRFPERVPVVFIHACIMLRLLYDVALDSFDKPTFCGSLNVKSPSLTRQSSAINEVSTPARFFIAVYNFMYLPIYSYT